MNRDIVVTRVNIVIKCSGVRSDDVNDERELTDLILNILCLVVL